MENQASAPLTLPKIITTYILGPVIFLVTIYLISVAWKKGQA